MDELFTFDELSVVFYPTDPSIEFGFGDEEVVFKPVDPIIPIDFTPVDPVIPVGLNDLPELDVA